MSVFWSVTHKKVILLILFLAGAMNLAFACHEGYLYPRDGHWSHSKEWKEYYSNPFLSSSAPSTGAGHSTVWSIESSANLKSMFNTLVQKDVKDCEKTILAVCEGRFPK